MSKTWTALIVATCASVTRASDVLEQCSDVKALYQGNECCDPATSGALSRSYGKLFDFQPLGPRTRPYAFSNTTWEYMVEITFLQGLGRLPTAAEFEVWYPAIRDKTANLVQLEDHVLNSDEFHDAQGLPRMSGGAYAASDTRCAVVTGGSSGVGYGLAVELARAGMKVLVTSRTRDVFDEHVALAAGNASHLHQAATVATADEWIARCESEDFDIAQAECATRVYDFYVSGGTGDTFWAGYMIPTERRHFYSGPIRVPSSVLDRMEWYGVDHRVQSNHHALWDHAHTYCGGTRPDVVVVNPTTWPTAQHRPQSRPSFTGGPGSLTLPIKTNAEIVALTPDRYTNNANQAGEHTSLMYDNIVYTFLGRFSDSLSGVRFHFTGSPTAFWHPQGTLLAKETYFRGKAEGAVLATQLMTQSVALNVSVSQTFPYFLRSDMVFQDLLEESTLISGGPSTWKKGHKGAYDLGVDRWVAHRSTAQMEEFGSSFKTGVVLSSQILAKLAAKLILGGAQETAYIMNFPFSPVNFIIHSLFPYLPEMGLDAANIPGADDAFWLDPERVQKWTMKSLESSAQLYGPGTTTFRPTAWVA